MSAVNPALVRRPPHGRQLPFAAVLVGAVFVALAAAFTIATLRSAADASHRAGSLVANLESTIHEQAALELGAIARGGLSPAEVSDLQASRDRAGVILAALAIEERSSFGLAGLKVALDAYRSALDEQLAALGAKDISSATIIEANSVNPARDTFRRVREATEARLEAGALDSATAADVGTLTSLLSSAILASLLFRRWERVRRRSAFIVGEQHGLRESEARFRGLVQHSSDLITIVGRDGTLAYVSPSSGRLLEVPSAALTGLNAGDLVHDEDRRRLADLLGAPPDEIIGRTIEWRLRTGDGVNLRHGWRTFESTVSTVDPSDPSSAVILNSRDVTDRRALEESLRHQAGHDPLTGLLNRTVLLDALERALRRASRAGGRVALVFVDLDEFKKINDSAGHVAGDVALAEIGSRIRRVVRADAAVARLGGDEFAILIEDLDEADQAFAVADRVLTAIERPLTVEGHDYRLAASAGIAFSSDGLDSAADILAAADQAMYEAKRAGGGRHAPYQGRMPGPAVA